LDLNSREYWGSEKLDPKQLVSQAFFEKKQAIVDATTRRRVVENWSLWGFGSCRRDLLLLMFRERGIYFIKSSMRVKFQA
jgi:hypothetical protein